MCESLFLSFEVFHIGKKMKEDSLKDKKKNMETRKVILRSAHPEAYGDLEIECKVIANDEIGAYLATIPEEEKFVAAKVAPVAARQGVEGEEVVTTLTTVVDGKEYIISEQHNTVRNRDGVMDVVVTNINSTSNESYIVKGAKFASTYLPGENALYVPAYDPRVLTRVSENVIIMTAWGEPALCLAGGYIVTYDAAGNDYNTLEKGAFESTYKPESDDFKRVR
jgi:hypothetical protein